MFSAAVARAVKYTRPLVGAVGTSSGSVRTFFATFMVLNKEGWVLTAAHALSHIDEVNEGIRRRAEIAEQVDNINKQVWKDKRKERAIAKLNSESVPEAHSCIFDGQMPDRMTWHYDRASDIALVKIENQSFPGVTEYPVFRKATPGPDLGSSVCRLGYAFHRFDVAYDSTRKHFDFAQNTFPVTLYVNEGVVSRHVTMQTGDSEPRQVCGFDTSSPGIAGQSGGPVLDVQGRVCGMQIQTVTLDLGFIGRAGDVEERQFANVGRVVGSSEILKMTEKHSISVSVCGEEP